MAEVPLNPVVGEVSPNLYKAAISANLPAEQRRMVEQMSHTYKVAQRLMKISEAEARKEFLQLTPDVQSNINYLFATEKRFQPEQGLVGKAVQAVGKGLTTGLGTIFSPLIAGLKAADAYGKVLNTPYKVFKQTTQGQPFSKNLISDAYDGKNSWDWDRVSEFEKTRGKALTALARGLAEGRTPGESIGLYGQVDEDMTDAIKFMGNEPKKMQKYVDEIKQYAQISPGRQRVGSWKSADDNVNKNYWAYKFNKFFGIDLEDPKQQIFWEKKSSGAIDGVYQILIDPMTYTGVGSILKAATKGIDGIKATPLEALKFGGFKSRGEKLADQFNFLAERKGLDAGMDFVFKQPDVIKLWDDQLGPVIKRYAEAPTPTEKGMIYREIRANFPEWAESFAIKEMAKGKAFDSVAAKKFFMEFDDAGLIFGGRVDGISARRNGIPVAKQYRTLTSAVNRTAKNVFDPTPSTATTKDIIEQGEKRLKSTMDILRKVADKEEDLVNPNFKEIFELNADLSKTQKNLLKIQTAMKRSPGRIIYGDDAIKTLEEVRNLAALTMPERIADGFAEAFLNELPEVQLTMVRNLYAAVMLKSGLHGVPGGDDFMTEVLSATFNEKGGMFSTIRSEISNEFAGVLHKGGVRWENEVAYQSSRGIVQPSQVANSIAPLPFDDIYQVASMGKFSQERNFLSVLGGATRNNLVRKFTDFWVRYTLFPRLGTRSAVDESFFGALVHPTSDMRAFVFGGRGTRKVTEAITGSRSTQGMYKRAFYKTAGKLGIKIDPAMKISGEERRAILEQLARDMSKDGREVTIAEVHHSLVMEETIQRVKDIYKNTLSKQAWSDLERAMKYSPSFLDSMVNSVGAKSGITGRIESDYIDQAFVSSNLTADLKALGLEQGSRYGELDVRKAPKKAVAIAHFDNWSIRFPYNQEKVAEGVTINPVNAFFRNDALRTVKDVTRARDGILKDIGADKLPGGYEGEYVITNPDTVKGFLSLFSTTVYHRQQGIPDVDIARIHVEAMLMDMRNTFHGGPKAFNEKLFDLVKSKRRALVGKADVRGVEAPNSWSKASANITFKEFEDATIDNLPTVNIMTRLKNVGPEKDMQVFEEKGTWAHLYEKWGNWTMDVMDATVTGFWRQPMLHIFYSKNLKELAPYEKVLEDRFVKQMKQENPNISSVFARNRAREQSRKLTTEIALNNAAQTLIEYVDNPAVKSNLAISVRSVGRFYRATEDFYRRVYRLYTKKPLQTLYRMRLLHTGLAASGDVYTDERGDQYVMFPTDTIINNAIEPVLRGLTGNNQLQIPTFDNLTLKLRLTNPSFSPDAGQPSLSGPIASLSVWVMKGLFREFPQFLPEPVEEAIAPNLTKTSDFLDNIMVGQFGDRVTIRSVFLPMFADSIFSTISPVEYDRQKTTALIQSIGWHQAFGNALPKNATAEEKAKYLSQLKWSAWGTVAARNMLGQVSPGQPQFRDGKDLPDFIKRTGITTWKGSFWDIYDGILKNQGDDIGDAYDLAVATFTGKNPGKLAFIIPRNTKEFKVFMSKTNELKSWAIDNKAFTNKYKEVAYLFAPNSGEYNPDVYTWMESEGLIGDVNFEYYLNEVQVAEDKQNYFKIEEDLNAKLKTSPSYIERKQLIDSAERTRQSMLYSSPILDAAINQGTSRGDLRVMFKTLSEAVSSANTPIDKKTRSAMSLAVSKVSGFISLANDPELKNRFDFSTMKAIEKAEVVKVIAELAKVSPAVKEANRIIFNGLLNAYSRESISAGTGGK
jgi:hypothetical protein